MTMHQITIEPKGLQLHVRSGETILAAAERQGWAWPTLCHGSGTCSLCWFEVISGTTHLSDAQRDELTTLEQLPSRVGRDKTVRLACQSRVQGDVVVRKTGVRPQNPPDPASA